MPAQSKVGWAQLKVGLLFMAALVIVGFLIFLMAGTQGLFQSKAELYTYLNDSNSLAEGAPVTLNGVGIDGKISKIEITNSNDPDRAVKVTMQVGVKHLKEIPVDSQTKLASANLLGTYYINIKRGMSPQTVQPGAVLPSAQTAQIADLFEQSSQTLGTLQSVVDKLNMIADDIQKGRGSIGALLEDKEAYNNFIDIENQFKQLASDLHNTLTSNNNSVGKLLNDNGAMYDDMRGILAQVNKVVDGINSGKGTLGQLAQNPAAYDDARQVLGDVHKLLADINAGQGTVGKLLKTDEYGEQIKSTLQKVDGLIDKMNNGNGTVARLLNDPALYEDLDSMTRETHGLIQDFRTNPKKFLHIKLGLF